MALDFIYTQPVKIIFGEGKFAQLGEVLQELGVQRCVIACGRHFAPTAKEMQEADSRIVGVFGGVEQNPQLSGVKETARIIRSALRMPKTLYRSFLHFAPRTSTLNST